MVNIFAHLTPIFPSVGLKSPYSRLIDDEDFLRFLANASSLPSPIYVPSCPIRRKIGFAKTHKTASSAVQNVVVRHALYRDFNFVLTASTNHLLDPKDPYDLSQPFSAEWLRTTPWDDYMKRNSLYDVVALHTKWNQGEFR